MDSDPREEITHEMTVGQVYNDARTDDEFELIYVDMNIYAVQDRAENHRFGKRRQFEDNVAAGRYTLLPDATSFAVTELESPEMRESVDFEELDNIGATAAENLAEAGYETVSDVKRATDDELLEVPWLGEACIESIREKA